MPGRAIQLPKQGPAGPLLASTAHLLKRNIENYRMAEDRSIPTHRRAWHVTTTVLEAPEWMLDVFASPSLPSDSHSFWMLHRRHAQRIAKLDREAGGEGRAMCVQLRLCRVCKRVLIGATAHEYAEKMRLPRCKWEFPSGPSCGVVCRPNKVRKQRA